MNYCEVYENVFSVKRKSYNDLAYFLSSAKISKEICFERGNVVKVLLNNSYSDSILEVGSGIGLFTEFLSEFSDELITVEVNKRFSEINALRNNDKNICFLNHIDFNKLYDVIWVNAFNILCEDYNFDNLESLICSLKTVLKEAGKIFLIAKKEKNEIEDIKKIDLGDGFKCDIRVIYPDLYNMQFLFYDDNAIKDAQYYHSTPNNEYNGYFSAVFYKDNEKSEKILFSKCSVFRMPQYQIITEIISVNSERYVTKYSYTGQSSFHIHNMKRNYDKLSGILSNTKFSLNKVLTVDNGKIKFEYLYGVTLFDEITAFMETDIQKAYELILRYAEIMRSIAVKKFHNSDEFRYIFGRSIGKEGDWCWEYTNMDLCFDNIIIDKDKWVIIDYEFCTDVLVPIDFIIWRSVFYLFLKQKQSNKYEDFKQHIYRNIGLKDSIKKYMKAEECFQKYVKGNSHYLNDMLVEFRNKEPFGLKSKVLLYNKLKQERKNDTKNSSK